MRLLNCSISEVIDMCQDKKIVFFGAGSWCTTVEYTELMSLIDNFEYIIDNAPKEYMMLGEKRLDIYYPQKIQEETDVAVIITSPIYGYNMYLQLKEMNLPDSVICFSLPFIGIYETKKPTAELLKQVRRCSEEKIPKIIHSFWFSGDEKPESYQKCLDTWKPVLKDYEIIEWNQDNYDVHKNRFLEKAIECKAWAFASDFARLDVLYNYGGIYLDMDIEVFQPFDDLLGNDALFSFSNCLQVDLAFLGSKKGNPIIEELLKLYDMENIPQSREDFSSYFQPTFVKPTLARMGVKMNGELQVLDNATVFPRDFFMPQEHVLFFPYERKEYTYCNHLDNFGWSFSGENKREKKIRENRLFFDEIEK